MRDFRTPAIAAFCTALLAACNGGSSLTGSMSATDSSSSNNSGGISVGSPGTSTPSNPTSPGGGGVAQSFELSLSGLNTGESVSVSLNGGRIGISNARPVQGCPPPLLERNQPYVASKLRSRVAGLENLAASRLRRRAFGRCRATKPASRAARMAPTPAFAAA
jgi:hypothetical protein